MPWPSHFPSTAQKIFKQNRNFRGRGSIAKLNHRLTNTKIKNWKTPAADSAWNSTKWLHLLRSPHIHLHLLYNQISKTHLCCTIQNILNIITIPPGQHTDCLDLQTKDWHHKQPHGAWKSRVQQQNQQKDQVTLVT